MREFKRIYSGEEALKQISEGVNAVANAVKVTLGPSGRNVTMERPFGPPQITKDGVSVARDIEFSDMRKLGTDIIKEASVRTADEAGDGTTTSMVMAQELFDRLRKAIAGGLHPTFLKKGMEVALKEALRFLDSYSVPVQSVDEIQKIATLSSNGDSALGELIAQAMEMVGKDGVIAVEESPSTETYLEFSEGLQLDRGYISRDFIIDPERADIKYENALVLVADQRLTDVPDVLPALEQASKEKRPLLIVAHDLEGLALQLCIHNHLQQNVTVCGVKAPRIGEKRTQILETIATLTNGIMLSPDMGRDIRSYPIDEILGSVDDVHITSETTTMIGGHGSDEEVEALINSLRSRMRSTGSEHDIEFYQQQMSQLGGGIAVIRVGATSEMALKEYKARVEDALSATQSAVVSGIVPGGGVTFLQISDHLRSLSPKLKENGFELYDEGYGFDLFVESLEKPFRQIMLNAGIEPNAALFRYRDAVQEGSSHLVLNARTNEFEDALESGIIDPTKVLVQVMKNSVSVSTLLASASAVIVSSKTEEYRSHED